jgi:carbon monoxide dehydrogenase subunit G
VATYDASIEIDASPEAIFPFLVEPDRLKQWVGGFVEARPLTTGPTRLGSKSIDVIREGNREMRFETEITGYEPPRGVTVRIQAPGMDAVSDYRLDGRGSRTRASHVQQVRYGGLLRVVGPLMGGMVRRKIREDLDRLKAAVEGS